MNQQELDNRLSQIKNKPFGSELRAELLTAIERKSDKRIFLLCEAENAYAVNKFLFEDIGARFCTVTGIDSDKCFELLYHYSYDPTGCVITVKTFIRNRQAPAIESITPLLPAAEWIEREIHDILGIDFRNHPNLKRLILADDWPVGVYPLRKDVKK